MSKKKDDFRTFEVTKDDIANGIARNSESCPLAEVIQRKLPYVQYVMVDLALIRWSNPKTRKRYVFITPKIAQQFIVDFDRGNHERLEPFTLRLQTPVQVVGMRNDKNRDRKLEWVKHKARQKTIVSVNSRGHATKYGGRLPPTVAGTNIQRVRKFGVRALIV